MNKLLQEALGITQEKKEASQQMNDLAKERAENIGLTKAQLLAIKDYKHYKGRGWGSDALDKSEEKVSYPDRVTPTFRKLVEIVKNLQDANMIDFLEPYLEACASRGVKITFDLEKSAVQDIVNNTLLDNTLDEMDALQCTICELNDRITDGLAPAAQEEHYVPKSKFKNVVEHAYRIINKNKEKAEEKIDEQVADNNLYNSALDDVRTADEQLKDA